MIYNENGSVIIETSIEKVYNNYIEYFDNMVSLSEAVNMDVVKEKLKKFGEKISTIIDKIIEGFNRLMDLIDSKTRTAIVAISNEKKIKSGWRAYQDIMEKIKNNEVFENRTIVTIVENINKTLEECCLFDIDKHLDKFDRAVCQFHINNNKTTDENDAESLANFYYDTLGKILIDKPFELEKLNTTYDHGYQIESQIYEYFKKATSIKLDKADDIINQAKANTKVNRKISMVTKSLLKIKDKNIVKRIDDKGTGYFNFNSDRLKITNIGIRILVEYSKRLIKEINTSVNFSTGVCICLAKLSKALNKITAIDADYTVKDTESEKSKKNDISRDRLRLTMA